MGEIKSSGSAGVIVDTDTVADVFGPWTALFMGVDQATHPITFGATWAHLVLGTHTLVGQFAGLRMDVELGVGPTDPPAETVFGPLKFTSWHTGGGRGLHTNYSWPLVLAAGDQLWCRIKKDATAAAGVQEVDVFLTVSDQVKPVRPATVHFATHKIFAPGTPSGVLFPGGDLLGAWYIMGNDGSGGGMPLQFDASWLSMNVELFNRPTLNARWQLGASRDGNPPDLPELIDIGFQSMGGGGIHVSEVGDVHNFPVNWEKGDTVWVRGASKPGVSPTNDETFAMAGTFWGNP